jgi:hypothetical protein
MTKGHCLPTYVIRLRPQPGVDAVRALRAALKVLRRRIGLRGSRSDKRASSAGHRCPLVKPGGGDDSCLGQDHPDRHGVNRRVFLFFPGPMEDHMRPIDMMPLDYLLSVINDPKANAARRDRLAMFCAPYCHPKIIQDRLRKKEIRERRAKQIAGPWADILHPAQTNGD